MNYWFPLPFNINNTYFYFVGNFTAGLKLNVKNKDPDDECLYLRYFRAK